MRQKGETLYLFPMLASTLSRISYVNPRGKDSPDEIQRLVSKSRAKEIGQYIKQDISLFPNAIVVSLGDEVEVTATASDDEVTLVFPSDEGKLAYVLDGQHRLAGFDYSDGIDMDLPVVALYGADESLRGKIFADINSKQVKVSDVHLLDLYYGLGDLPGDEMATVQVVKRLGNDPDSPLHGRVQFFDDQQGAWIKNTALTRWLGPHIKSGGTLSSKTPAEQTRIIKEYFRGVAATWPDAWGSKSHALTKPFGLEVMCSVFRAAKHRVDLNAGRQYTAENFERQLAVLRHAQIEPFGQEADIAIVLTWESGPLGPLSNAAGRGLIGKQLIDTLQRADDEVLEDGDRH